MPKFILALTFLLLSSSFVKSENYNDYFQLSNDGKYLQASKNFKSYVDDLHAKDAEPYQFNSLFSRALRDSVLFEDRRFFDVVEQNIIQFSNDARNDKGKFDQQSLLGIGLLLDISRLNTEITRDEKFRIISNYSQLPFSRYLSDVEYTFACQQKINFLIREALFEAGLVEAYVCMSNVASFNNLDSNAAFDLISSFVHIKKLNNLSAADAEVYNAIDKLITSNTLNFYHPSTINGFATLAVSEVFRGSTFVQNISQVTSQLLSEDTYVSYNQRLKIQWAYDQVDSYLGLDKIENLNGKNDLKTSSQIFHQTVLRDFIRSEAPTDWESHSPIVRTYLSDLVELLNTDEIDFDEVTKEALSVYSETRRVKQTSENFLTFERKRSAFESLLLTTALKAAEEAGDSLSLKNKEILFSHVFSNENHSDFRNAIFANEKLVQLNMGEIASSYLKLSQDLNLKMSRFVNVVAEKAIDLVERNYEYKKRDNFTSDGRAYYDFLVNHKKLRDVVWHFNWITDSAYSNIFTEPTVSIEKIQDALSRSDVVIAYKRGEFFGSSNSVYKCWISKLNFDCSIDEIPVNFDDTVFDFRTKIVGEKGGVLDQVQASQIYQTLFPVLDLNRFDQVFLHPDPKDLSVPFNALIDNDGQYLGLAHNFYFLGSLVPTVKKIDDFEKPKLYLGLGDPTFRTEVVLDTQLSSLFKLRSGGQIKEVLNLSRLPETRDEVLDVAASQPSTARTVLLGEDATELNLRLAAPGEHKFIHFATHGLTSGSFEGKREPALALSIDESGTNTFNDALLTESEILELKLYGSSVFLSACETASDYGGEEASGFVGLAQSFLLSGANQVTATQWKIESSSAAKIIADTVKNSINQSETNSSAIRSALVAYHNENPDPYYWAPFIVFKNLEKSNSDNHAVEMKSKILEIPEMKNSSLDPIEIMEADGEIFVTGTQMLRPRAKHFLMNLNTEEISWFEDKKGTPTFLGKNGAVLNFFNMNSSKYPSISKYDTHEDTFEQVHEYDLSEFLYEKFGNFGNFVLGIVAKVVHENDRISMVLNVLPNPERSDFDEALKTFNHHVLFDLNIVTGSYSLNILPKLDVPQSLPPRFLFIGGDLFMAIGSWDPDASNVFEAAWGISGNESKLLQLFKFNKEWQEWEINKKFHGYTNIEAVIGSRTLLGEGGVGAVFNRFYDVATEELSGRLPVVSGSANAKAFKLEGGTVFFGDLKIPATFREEFLSSSGPMTATEYMYDRNVVLDPTNQWLRYILFEDSSGELFNVSLEFSRLLAFFSGSLVYNNKLYFYGQKERTNLIVNQIDLDDIRTVFE